MRVARLSMRVPCPRDDIAKIALGTQPFGAIGEGTLHNAHAFGDDEPTGSDMWHAI